MSDTGLDEAAAREVDESDICGETFDHDLEITGSGDGETTYRCLRCDAELVEKDGQ